MLKDEVLQNLNPVIPEPVAHPTEAIEVANKIWSSIYNAFLWNSRNRVPVEATLIKWPCDKKPDKARFNSKDKKIFVTVSIFLRLSIMDNNKYAIDPPSFGNPACKDHDIDLELFCNAIDAAIINDFLTQKFKAEGIIFVDWVIENSSIHGFYREADEAYDDVLVSLAHGCKTRSFSAFLLNSEYRYTRYLALLTTEKN